MDCSEARDNNLGQGALTAIFLAVDCFLVLRHVKERLLQFPTEGDHLLAPILGDPLVDLGEKLVLLPDVVFLAQVDQVNDGFRCEQLFVIDVFDFVHAPVFFVPHIFSIFQPTKDDLASSELFLLLFLEPSGNHFVEIFDGPLDHFDVFQPQFLVDDLHIFHRIDTILHMDNFHVFKRSADVEDPVHGTDIGQEGVSQPRPFVGTFDQSSDVVYFQERRDLALWMVGLTEPIEPFIRYVHPGHVWFDGAERKIFCWNAHLREGVEQGGFPYVGQSHDSHLLRIVVHVFA
mmetsp:Transcript_3205/g.19839  ORF Transcript_3205/g.19839 Transcript_3205/m.19839 type:complete len:289 (+) Transcript_3205:2410-3276(+)